MKCLCARTIVGIALSASVFISSNAAGQGNKGGGGGNPAGGQQNSQSSPGASPAASPSSQGSGQALPGVSYDRESWDSMLSFLPPPTTFGIGKVGREGDFKSFWDRFSKDTFRKNVIVNCYRLVPNLSAAVPFVLVPEPLPEGAYRAKRDEAKLTAQEIQDIQFKDSREMCANMSYKSKTRALVMSRFLVFRIDMSGIPEETVNRIQTLNINVTTQAGTSLNSQRGSTINPTPTKPTMALLSPPHYTPITCPDKLKEQTRKYTLAGAPLQQAFCPPAPPEGSSHKVFYITWPGELVGDTIVTSSINIIYTPVAPGLPWQGETYYPAGSTILAQEDGSEVNGHYYVAVNGGVSGSNEPDFDANLVEVQKFSDSSAGPLTWRIAGRIQPGSGSQTPPGGGANPGGQSKYAFWKPTTPYKASDQVVPPMIGNGHYYEAVNQGTSGAEPPTFPVDGNAVCDGQEKSGQCQTAPVKGKAATSGVLWQDMGQITIASWAAGTGYAKGAQVAPNPANGFYYETENGGVSGSTAPAFPVDVTTPSAAAIDSAGLVWLDAGAGATTPASVKTLKKWEPETAFQLGDGILDRRTGHYYVAIQPGISGARRPRFFVPAPQWLMEGPIKWQDIGTTLPASVSAGTPPSDQTVNVLNLTYPQVQVLSRFNLTSGVVASSLRPTSISSFTTNIAANCPNGATSCTLYTASKGSHLIDPVLGVTVYAIRPLDAERPFAWSDLIPAPTLDISLSSPTTNFHFGFASELFMRNLQLIYGTSFVQETRLPKGGTFTANGLTVALSTTKQFNRGGFFGLTFNITGFIQSLIP